MIISLYVKGSFIHAYPMNIVDYQTPEQRASIVHEIVNNIKAKYRMSLMLTTDWEIRLQIKSKMNEIRNDE